MQLPRLAPPSGARQSGAQRGRRYCCCGWGSAALAARAMAAVAAAAGEAAAAVDGRLWAGQGVVGG